MKPGFGTVAALAAATLGFVASAHADVYELTFYSDNLVDFVSGTILFNVDTSNNITGVLASDTYMGVTTNSKIDFWIFGQTPTIVPFGTNGSWQYDNQFTGNLAFPFDYSGPLFVAGSYHVKLFNNNGTNWLSTDYTGFSGSSWYNPGQQAFLTVTKYGAVDAVGAPEASTWAMMSIGFLGLGFFGFRSQRQMRALT